MIRKHKIREIREPYILLVPVCSDRSVPHPVIIIAKDITKKAFVKNAVTFEADFGNKKD